MTKLLDKAVAKARSLPDRAQDELALAMLNIADQLEEPEDEPVALDAETRAAILDGLAEVERGEYVTEEEMAELWKRFGA